MENCSSCGAAVVWLPMVKKDGEEKPHIFNAKPVTAWMQGEDGKVRSIVTFVSHWATCPTREQHRRSVGD